MGANIKYRMLGASGQANLVWADAADTTELAATACSIGSIGTIAGDPDKLYIFNGASWDLLDKPSLLPGSVPEYDGINPITLLAAMKLLQPSLLELNALNVMTTQGDIIVRGASAPERLELGALGRVLYAGSTGPFWQIPGNLLISDSNNVYDTDTIDGALNYLGAVLLGFKGTASAAPASGNYLVNDKYFNSEPAPEDFIGWVCTGLGTMGTLNGGATTGDILIGTDALTVSNLTGLEVGQYIDVATVSGALQILSLPAALGSTAVDAESLPEQKVLSVASTDNFAVGDTVCIGFSANCEIGVIDSIQEDESLTLVDDLTLTHAIAETVTNCVLLDADADVTADDQAVSFHNATGKGFGAIEAE